MLEGIDSPHGLCVELAQLLMEPQLTLVDGIVRHMIDAASCFEGEAMRERPPKHFDGVTIAVILLMAASAAMVVYEYLESKQRAEIQVVQH